MHKWKSILKAFTLSIAAVVLILDSKTAISGGREGVMLCIHSVIPSLFPFIFLSGIINALITSNTIFLRPLSTVFNVPRGAEGALLIGLIGGYPVGAQCISQLYKDKQLDKSTAEKMLSFCNNAGPAFIFGIIASAFAEKWMIFALWACQLIGAYIVSRISCNHYGSTETNTKNESYRVVDALNAAIRACAGICGWVILFRVIIAVLEKWCMYTFNDTHQVLIAGILEMTNGCLRLGQLSSIGERFVVASIIISFGGICVSMQVSSICCQLNLRQYYIGKLLQTCVSATTSYLLQLIFLEPSERLTVAFPTCALILIISGICIFALKTKNVVANTPKMLYSVHKRYKEVRYAVQKKDRKIL